VYGWERVDGGIRGSEGLRVSPGGKVSRGIQVERGVSWGPWAEISAGFVVKDYRADELMCGTQTVARRRWVRIGVG